VTSAGLGWSNERALSLYGTFLASSYISPLIGSLVADFFLGKKWVILFGYSFAFLGLTGLLGYPSEEFLLPFLLLLSLGIGSLKVCLTSLIGERRVEKYDYLYFALCFAYIFSTLLSPILLHHFGIAMLFKAVFAALFLSFLSQCFVSVHEKKKEEIQEVAEQGGGIFFFLLLFLGFIFFIFSNQTSTSFALYLEQYVGRKIGSITIPTLYFAAAGSFSIILTLPLRQKVWSLFSGMYGEVNLLRFSVAFALLAVGFVLAFSAPFTLSFFFIYPLFFIGDAHVRPLLLSLCARYMSPKYQTFATALVYITLGAGAKSAAFFARFLTPSSFLLVSGGMFSFAAVLFFLWRRQRAQVKLVK